MGFARKKTLNNRNAPITIFCDSQKALKIIQHPPFHEKNLVLRSLIHQNAGELQSNGHSIAIWWILSYSGLLRNEKADFTPKAPAEKGEKLLECSSSLAHIKKNLIDIRHKKITKWHKTRMHEKETSYCGYYIPWTRGGINPILGNAPKKYASRYSQLKVGNRAVRTFLARTGVVESPECWRCKETIQSVGIYTTDAANGRKNRES